jgi:hypothetical protein
MHCACPNADAQPCLYTPTAPLHLSVSCILLPEACRLIAGLRLPVAQGAPGRTWPVVGGLGGAAMDAPRAHPRDSCEHAPLAAPAAAWGRRSGEHGQRALLSVYGRSAEGDAGGRLQGRPLTEPPAWGSPGSSPAGSPALPDAQRQSGPRPPPGTPPPAPTRRGGWLLSRAAFIRSSLSGQSARRPGQSQLASQGDGPHPWRGAPRPGVPQAAELAPTALAVGTHWERTGPLEAQARLSWAPELQRPQADLGVRRPAGAQAAAGAPPRGIWGLSGECGFDAAAARGSPAARGGLGARSVAASADVWGLAAAPLGSPPPLPRARRGGFAAAALAGSFCWRAGRQAAERAACHGAGAAAVAPGAARADGASAQPAQTARRAPWAPLGAAAAPADLWGGPAAEAGAPAPPLSAEPPTSSSAGSSSAADASSAGLPLRESSGGDGAAARLPHRLLGESSAGSCKCEPPGALLEARERVGATGGCPSAALLGGPLLEGCAAGADWRGCTEAPRFHPTAGLGPLAPWQALDGQAGSPPPMDGLASGGLRLDLGALGLRAPAGGRMCSRYGFAGASGQTAGGDAGPVCKAERAPEPPATAPSAAERGCPSEAVAAAVGGLGLLAPPSGLGSRFDSGRAAASEARPGAEAAAAPAAERAAPARPLAPGSAGAGAVAGAAGPGARAAADGRAASGPGAACKRALGAAEAAAPTPAAQPAGGQEVDRPSLHAHACRGAEVQRLHWGWRQGWLLGVPAAHWRRMHVCAQQPRQRWLPDLAGAVRLYRLYRNMHSPVRRAWRRRPALPVRRRRACRCLAGRTAPGAGTLSTRELLHSLACHHYASRDGAECCHAQCSAVQAAARSSSSVPRACTWAGAQAAGARTERKGQVSFTVRSSVAIWCECISAHL